MTKTITDMKVGEISNEDVTDGLLVPPIKCVKIAYTVQDKDGNQLEAAIKSKDYVEPENIDGTNVLLELGSEDKGDLD